LLKEMPHPKAGRMRYVGNPVRFSKSERAAPRHPPVFAEHTDEVLRSLGMDADDILALHEAGVVRQS
jgi:crotonobetainyl-CoA:carnitine CoA-transferase CaiB-like acyl-CoA transferase